MDTFWKRVYLRLEILGYSRAIGSVLGVQGITAAHVKGLYLGRQEAQDKLAKLKADAKVERFGRSMTNA